MKSIGRLVRALAGAGVVVAAAATLVSMVIVAYSVVMRYFFNHPTPWVDELVGYLLVASVMLAAADALFRGEHIAADALFRGEHIAVDVLTERLVGRGRKIVALLGLGSVAVIAALLTWEGVDMIAFSRMVDLRSNGYLAAPMWVPQLAVPVGAALLGVAALVAFAAAWRAPRPAPKPQDPSLATTDG